MKQLSKFTFGQATSTCFTGIILLGNLMVMSCSSDDAPVDPDPIPTFPTEPGVHELSVGAGGSTRWFQLSIPQGYDDRTPIPLLLAFHGGGGASRSMLQDRQDLLTRARENTFFIAFKQGYNRTSTLTGSATWNAEHCCGEAYEDNVDDIAFVSAVVATLQTKFKVDGTRVHATGFSNGGMLTHRLGAELPDLFAALSVNSGTVGTAERRRL